MCLISACVVNLAGLTVPLHPPFSLSLPSVTRGLCDVLTRSEPPGLVESFSSSIRLRNKLQPSGIDNQQATVGPFHSQGTLTGHLRPGYTADNVRRHCRLVCSGLKWSR